MAPGSTRGFRPLGDALDEPPARTGSGAIAGLAGPSSRDEFSGSPALPRPRARRWPRAALACGLALLALTGCKTRRILRVESDPPGAQVRLDDELIGRTPLEHEFQHYGTRRLTLYLGGYHTWSQPLELSAPWHARFPIDVVTEVLIPMGLTDRHAIEVRLEPDLELGEELDFAQILENARAVRETVAHARISGGEEGATPPSETEAEGGEGRRE